VSRFGVRAAAHQDPQAVHRRGSAAPVSPAFCAASTFLLFLVEFVAEVLQLSECAVLSNVRWSMGGC